jgi:hypothetical protein
MESGQRNADFLTPPPFIPRIAERLMILVTDDDGIHSEGIIVLAKALQEMGMFLSLPRSSQGVSFQTA